MRKLFILPLIVIFLTGCIKYQELNNMAIITTIGIDKTKSTYEITLKETIPKKAENKVAYEYKYYKGKGESIDEALKNASDNASKDIYLRQVQNIMVTNPQFLKKVPAYLKNSIVLFRVKNLDKILRINSNYKYLNNLAKDKTITLKQYKKNNKKKIPYIKVYKQELLIKN